jgi:hypothetical protein
VKIVFHIGVNSIFQGGVKIIFQVGVNSGCLFHLSDAQTPVRTRPLAHDLVRTPRARIEKLDKSTERLIKCTDRRVAHGKKLDKCA